MADSGWVLALFLSASAAWAAGQTSASYRVVADVHALANPDLAGGSSHYQASRTVCQASIAGLQGSPSYYAEEGFQAAAESFDSDYDGIPDDLDPDLDGDGVLNGSDIRPYDTDNDGANNLADPDDDGEGLADEEEWQFGTSLVRRDTDEDSANDYEEWVAGTDGTDSNDYFSIETVSNSVSGFIIQWYGEAGRQYDVQSVTNVFPAQNWQPIYVTNALAPGWMQYRDSSKPPRRFYRLRVQRL